MIIFQDFRNLKIEILYQLGEIFVLKIWLVGFDRSKYLEEIVERQVRKEEWTSLWDGIVSI